LTLPYSKIADATRWMRKQRTYSSVEQALFQAAQLYRKDLWADADVYVELWLEKDALAGVVFPVTELYDIPLMVSRGYTSETFTFEAIEAREGDDRPYVVYNLGDFDRSGRDAAASLKEKLRRFAKEKGVDVDFVDLAIEEGDIIEFDANTRQALVNLNGEARWLPTRAPKRESAADKKWPFDFAIELDAIAPDDMRAMVQRAIEHHLPADQLRLLQIAEASERELIAGLVAKIAGEAEQ
jgi:hypothetical protein